VTPSTDTAAQERIGQVLSQKYRIARLLGSGGMGHVFEAENLALGKRVALKFLHMAAQAKETSLLRFQREARAISAVESTHIVQVFDWGNDDRGQPFLVMELLEGRDLAERIKQLGRLPVAEAVRFCTEALRGLRRVHQAGIVHRDLKPENLFLVTGDDDLLHVKIVDFGLSKLMESDSISSGDLGVDFERSARLTREGAIVGTPLYMAPEQVEAVVPVDTRADIWAIGAILYEMLSGSPPFMDRSYARLVMAICQRDPAPLARINPEVSPELEAVIRGAMTRDRDERFQSADEFLAALAKLPVTKQMVIDSGDNHPAASLMSSGVMLPASPPEAHDDGKVAVTPKPGDSAGGPLDATIAAHTRGAATVWLTDAPVFSLWRGEVDSPDRLRIETRDGSVRDLRLEPVGRLKLGRVKQVGDEINELVYPDVASRLAGRLEHDGIRWWIERREECSVPVQVGARSLGRGEKAPLVHGTFVSVGAMRATFVDRRYVSRAVGAGTVDAASGLLARGGLEQEVATVLQQKAVSSLVLLMGMPDEPSVAATAVAPSSVRMAVALHRLWPGHVVARCEEAVALLVRGGPDACVEHARLAGQAAVKSGLRVLSVGYWSLEGEAPSAGSETELALDAIETAAGPGARGVEDIVDLRQRQQRFRMSLAGEVLERGQSPKHQILLFGIEEQSALERIGPSVVGALEQELAAVIASAIGPSAMVTKLAPGVIASCIPRKLDAASLGVQVQCEWHARPPITDGKLELPRTLSWEEAAGERAQNRAAELSRECSDAHGVLSALSGGLPYPIAGRVHAAIAASSAVERVKMLFDVLEGAWRFIAIVLAAAYFAKGGEGDHTAIRALYEKHKTRAGFPLGAWRELARTAVKGFESKDDLIGQLARQLLDVKISDNQTFDALSNLMHSERNAFAHGHYNEARAASDVKDFEQMTRSFLRALRPLCAWTLVTVQRTEPDLFGESQTVEFIDHTGPYANGARRRFGFASPVRLANVVYLARWRDGLVLPLEPFIRRIAHEDRFDLFWMDHLPRAGTCNMSAVVGGESVQAQCDVRRLPPLLRGLATT
jgi:serine/threonine protein kinase